MHNAAVNIYGQSIPIQKVCIYKFTYWLKFICSPKMNMLGTITVIHRHGKVAKNLNHSMHAVPAEVEQATLCLLVLAFMIGTRVLL